MKRVLIIATLLLSMNAFAIDMPLIELSKDGLAKVRGEPVALDFGHGIFAKVYPSTLDVSTDRAGILASMAIGDSLILGGEFSYKKHDCYKGYGIVSIALGDESHVTAWSGDDQNIFSAVAKHVCNTVWGINIDVISNAINTVYPNLSTASNLMHNIDELNDQCRGGPSDNPTTIKLCDSRDAKLKDLEKLGWCWGNGSATQSGSDKTWQECKKTN